MMFKSTQPLYKASRRLRLTTKQASVGGGYYKGTGVGSMGWHTKHGGYIIDLRKVRTYVPPAEITDSLRPFIQKAFKKPQGPYEIQTDLEKKGLWKAGDEATLMDRVDRSWIGPLDGQRYLDMWKDKASMDGNRIPAMPGQSLVLPGQPAPYEVRSQLNEPTQKKTKKS